MYFLYTNYNGERVAFYDLLPVRRVHGSNESEQILTDSFEIEFWQNKLTNSERFDSDPFMQGIRAYRKLG